MLDEHRQGFRDRGDRCRVPVIVMGVGDDHRINIDNFIAGKQQLNQRIAQFARGYGKPGQAPLSASIGSMRNLFPA